MPPSTETRINRRQATWGLALGAMGTLGTLGGWTPAQAQSVSEAELEARAPALPKLGSVLSVPDIARLDGSAFHAGSGQPLLLYWWASTCPFCALQSPSMQALWQAQQSRGLQMLALSIDKTPEEARAYLNKRGYTFPSAWASPAWRRQFPKPKGLPVTLLLDAQRKVVLAEKGQLFPEDVEAIGQMF
jgi:peroxiredoxin